ncbi:MAG: hypothetical protein M1500_03295 [Candidatus Marsarchaeota archaeon]|nr:hypothetical protein [Candidatus Marsarchaeota archaeon]MCL5112708.1 hypothetical protein [Candidatus Marsarchaeota archaeon]
MRYMSAAILAVMVLLSSTAAATAYVSVIEPYNLTVHNNGTVYLGKVGPGQTFNITISSATKSANGTLYEYGWNELSVSGTPSGWVTENSALNTKYLTAQITPSSVAANGTYSFNLSAINTGNYSKLGSVRFKAYVNVTPDVFSINVSPTELIVGPGQPATIYVTINNTGVSDSPFSVSMAGLSSWNLTESVIALHHTQKRFTYAVYESVPGTYHTILHVSSAQSPAISKDAKITIVVRAGIANDYIALGGGPVAFPIIYEPIYAIQYLISLALRH